MKSPARQSDDTRSVREAMNRIGLVLFPDQWTGKEYLDHWRLGLTPWPPTKLRGMEAVRELLVLVWAGRVTVEVEISEGIHAPVPAEQVFNFHGGQSLVGDAEEVYRPCRLRFPPVLSAAMTSKGGRKGYDYAPVVVRVLRYLDRHGPGASIDHVTNSTGDGMHNDRPAPPDQGRQRQGDFPWSRLGRYIGGGPLDRAGRISSRTTRSTRDDA